MKRYFKFVLLLGICLIFLTGCIVDLVVPENDVNSSATEGNSTDENPVEGLGTGKGTLKIYLTDAPGDYLEVNITISKIEAHLAGDDEENEGYWITLKEWPSGEEPTFDLIKLQNVSELLVDETFEAGKYTQLRLFLMSGEEDAWVVLNDLGLTEEPLEIPSVYQTGIKLNRSFEIVEDMITKLTIDFDAEKSVIKTGNGKYKMKPVIHVTSETINVVFLSEEPGGISGIVVEDSETELPINGATVSAALSGSEYIFNSSAVTDLNGEFVFEQLPVGSYDLIVSAIGYVDHTEIGIGVTAGGIIDVGIIELEPLPPPLP